MQYKYFLVTRIIRYHNPVSVRNVYEFTSVNYHATYQLIKSTTLHSLEIYMSTEVFRMYSAVVVCADVERFFIQYKATLILLALN